MCIIVDANQASRVFGTPGDVDVVPIWKWINSGGRVAVGGQNRQELYAVRKARNLLEELSRVGRLKKCDDGSVQARSQQLASECGSDDPHVVALAEISGARVIVTDDQGLEQDLLNPRLLANPRRSVYKRAAHAHLLRGLSCP